MRPETEVIETLLQVGVKNVNAATKANLMTPLHLAAQHGNLGAVQLLIDSKADVNAETYTFDLFLYYAVRNGNLDLIKYCTSKTDIKRLQQNWGDYEPIGYFAAREAIKYGQLDAYLYFENIIRYDICDSVHTAAKHGKLDLLRYFIETQHKSVNGSLTEIYIPIFEAVRNDQLQVLKYFIEEQKVDINICHRGQSLIHQAIYFNYCNILQYLVTKGINLQAVDDYGNTLLHEAIPGRNKMLKFLLEQHTIDINAVNTDGATALHKAAQYSGEDMKSLELLCKYKPDVTIRNEIGETASDIMITDGKKPMFCLAANRYRKKVEVATQDVDIFSIQTKLEKESSVSENKKALMKYFLLHSPEHSLTNAKSLLTKPDRKAYEEKHLYGKHMNKSMDLMGVMLLLGVFLKKMNGQKYKFVGEVKTSTKDARSVALNVTSRFEEFLSSSKLVPSEHIDISKVYSDILRAVISNNANKLPVILRSYTELFPDIKPTKFEAFLKDNELKPLTSKFRENK